MNEFISEQYGRDLSERDFSAVFIWKADNYTSVLMIDNFFVQFTSFSCAFPSFNHHSRY